MSTRTNSRSDGKIRAKKEPKVPQLAQELKVHPVLGEPTRFRVQSESKQRTWYLVELSGDPRQSRCDCQNWIMRVQKQNRTTKGPVLQCKHQLAALQRFAFDMLRRIEQHQAK